MHLAAQASAVILFPDVVQAKRASGSVIMSIDFLNIVTAVNRTAKAIDQPGYRQALPGLVEETL